MCVECSCNFCVCTILFNMFSLVFGLVPAFVPALNRLDTEFAPIFWGSPAPMMFRVAVFSRNAGLELREAARNPTSHGFRLWSIVGVGFDKAFETTGAKHTKVVIKVHLTDTIRFETNRFETEDSFNRILLDHSCVFVQFCKRLNPISTKLFHCMTIYIHSRHSFSCKKRTNPLSRTFCWVLTLPPKRAKFEDP